VSATDKMDGKVEIALRSIAEVVLQPLNRKVLLLHKDSTKQKVRWYKCAPGREDLRIVCTISVFQGNKRCLCLLARTRNTEACHYLLPVISRHERTALIRVSGCHSKHCSQRWKGLKLKIVTSYAPKEIPRAVLTCG
jgi:hypothetical protein